LQAVFLPEAFLDGMQLIALRQTFDRGHTASVSLDCKQCAGLDGPAIEQHGAGTTQGCLAAYVGAGQPGGLSQEVHQQQARLDLGAMLDSINVDCDVFLHVQPPTAAEIQVGKKIDPELMI
jgi:hypothetical protein